MEGFLDNDSDSFDVCASLFNDLNQAFGSLAVSQEVINDENLIFRSEELACDRDSTSHLLSEGVNLSSEDTFIHGDIFSLLSKDHRDIQSLSSIEGWSNTRCLDSYHLGDACILELFSKDLSNLTHEVKVHLVSEERVNFEDVLPKDIPIFENAVFQ